MNRTRAGALLREVEENYHEWRTPPPLSCRFVFGELLPALGVLDDARASRRDRKLLGTGYAFLGDVHDFNEAPLAAARAYRAAVRCDPDDGWSWRELGQMLTNVARYRAALRALRRAEPFLGDDTSLRWYVTEAEERLRDGDAPWYRNGGQEMKPAPCWDAAELLARNRPKAALRLLAGRRHPYLRKVRARCFGALGRTEEFLEEWRGLARTKGAVELECADWFHLPEGATDGSGWWRALWPLRHRFVHGWSTMHDALFEIVPFGAKSARKGPTEMRRHRRRVGLWLRYNLARTENDAPRAARLAARYPRWKEARRLARPVSARGAARSAARPRRS